MVPRLYENKVSVDCIGTRSSNSSDFTHCSSEAAAVIARYSTSVEEQAIVCCFVELQQIGLAPRNIRKALVEVRSSRLSTQSALRNHAMFEKCLQQAVYRGISCPYDNEADV